MISELDWTSYRCPLLLVKAKQVIKQLGCGESVIFIVADSSFYDDLNKLTAKLNIQLQRSSYEHSERILVTSID